ncbi:FAD-dependent oxidoreductase [Caballeronia sp. AZ7_KS35]|uniref:NAD(P)/FAD-dependent oxidoreductase n=1 Tax=Caballeronia sp. AZ7_KS35 TaxID=2921762 RepID=UPI0020280DBA|nr:FAD-dependent oxidoreductase [Caballeronia sp. AZ7_KS35]
MERSRQDHSQLARTTRSSRIAVVGGGVVGLSCALWLQRVGHTVTVFDRALPEDESSYAKASSYGNACTFAVGACIPVASPGILKAVPKMLLDRSGPLSIYWRDLPGLMSWLLAFVRAGSESEVSRIAAVLGSLIRFAEPAHRSLMEEAGAAGLARHKGCLYLYRTDEHFKEARREIELREREGVKLSFLSHDQVREREPNLAPHYAKGMLFDEAYQLDNPYRYLLALTALFRSKGGTFERADIRHIRSENDRVTLEGSAPDAGFDRVVVAAGAWSRKLASTVGDRVLLNTERGYHVLFPESGSLLSAPTCYPEFGFYMSPLEEGLRSAGTVELGGLDRPPRPVRTDRIEAMTRRLLPGVGAAGRTWLGFRPSMPDSLPVIGHSDTDPRVVYAFGHGHIGLTLAGITGRLVTELVEGVAPCLDIGALNPTRSFTSTTPVKQGA